MSGIPEDVWTRIAEMVERLADEHEASSHTQEEKAGFLFEAIAALILSEREAARAEERERCAQKALEVGSLQADGWRANPKQDGCGGEVAAANCAFFIATAIREQKP